MVQKYSGPSLIRIALYQWLQKCYSEFVWITECFSKGTVGGTVSCIVHTRTTKVAKVIIGEESSF